MSMVYEKVAADGQVLGGIVLSKGASDRTVPLCRFVPPLQTRYSALYSQMFCNLGANFFHALLIAAT